jgi:lipopolysaccharide export system ATP-binding protein
VGLAAHDLKKIYSKRSVVDGVSIEVKQGEVVGLLGPNGAGKTTVFYMIVGMIRPNGGAVTLDDEDITSQPMYQRARRGIGYLPQETSVFRRLTVEENIMAILEMMGLSRAERRHRLAGLMEELNVARLARHKAFTLSGGERRRVEISRTLAADPKFILLDEPFTGIYPIAREDIQNIVSHLKTKGLGVLITDHNVRETLQITDRAYIIHEGKILKSGTAQLLAGDPEARRIYLGEKFRLD